jgi:hypothetical protein
LQSVKVIAPTCRCQRRKLAETYCQHSTFWVYRSLHPIHFIHSLSPETLSFVPGTTATVVTSSHAHLERTFTACTTVRLTAPRRFRPNHRDEPVKCPAALRDCLHSCPFTASVCKPHHAGRRRYGSSRPLLSCECDSRQKPSRLRGRRSAPTGGRTCPTTQSRVVHLLPARETSGSGGAGGRAEGRLRRRCRAWQERRADV